MHLVQCWDPGITAELHCGVTQEVCRSVEKPRGSGEVARGRSLFFQHRGVSCVWSTFGGKMEGLWEKNGCNGSDAMAK